MRKTELAAIDPALTARLGQIAINWAQIEEWLGHTLASFVGADPGGLHILTSSMGVSTVIDALKTIVSIFEPRTPELSAVRALLEEADELRVERNELIHGIWSPVGCEPGTCIIQTTGWKRAEITRERLVTTFELDQLLEDLNHWIDTFVDLGMQFDFPRLHGSTRSIFADDVSVGDDTENGNRT